MIVDTDFIKKGLFDSSLERKVTFLLKGMGMAILGRVIPVCPEHSRNSPLNKRK
jgi:hypothetical protein